MSRLYTARNAILAFDTERCCAAVVTEQLARKLSFGTKCKLQRATGLHAIIQHSTSSLPRDAIHSADYAVVRCPSVRLSVTRRYSVKTVTHIL